MTRAEAHAQIAELLTEWFPDQGWTPERVAEMDRRLAIDDADIPEPLTHYAEFALQLLDRAALIEPYEGQGDLR
jgi:hypothetical protein